MLILIKSKGFKVHGCGSSKIILTENLILIRISSDTVVCFLPIHLLIKKLPRSDIIKIANLHNIAIFKRYSIKRLTEIVSEHICSEECSNTMTTFTKYQFVFDENVNNTYKPQL